MGPLSCTDRLGAVSIKAKDKDIGGGAAALDGTEVLAGLDLCLVVVVENTAVVVAGTALTMAILTRDMIN